MARRFILASGSPRRRELLEAAGCNFEIVLPDVAETHSEFLSLREVTLANAIRKGRAVADLHPEAVVLAADTLVALDGQLIGKPASLEHARETLRLLAGRTHQVCSGVFVGCRNSNREHLFYLISHVRFRELSGQAITRYLAKIDPLDKAGAYAAQGHGGEVIAEITGSFSNVVGLPLAETICVLRQFGIQPTSATSRTVTFDS